MVSDLPATVLVVDDDAATRTLLRSFLRQHGVGVREAADGAEALRVLAEADIDLILLDHVMPGPSGLDTLRHLRAAGHPQPVILMVPVGAAVVVVAAMAAGAQDHVTTPFALPIVLARIRSVWRPPIDVEAEVEAEVEADDVVSEDELRVVMAPCIPPMPAPPDTSPSLPLPAITLPSVATPPPRLPVDEPRPATLPRTSSTLLSRLASWTRTGRPVVQPGLDTGAVLMGQYLLGDRLGEGTFGTVWRARHLDLDLDVAVKVLHRDAQPVRPHETALESFRQEAVLAARVRSPQVVRVLDFDETPDGYAFLVMELLHGETLRHRLQREERLAVADAVATIADVCDGLAACHDRGVVHRDVKALNVFCLEADLQAGGPLVKLIDFGAAGAIDDPRGGVVLVGTPTHMAPERFVDARGTPAADVYAAGILFFQLLTGAVPFSDPDVEALAVMHRMVEVPPPSRLRPEAHALDAIVVRMLAKQAERRPTAAQVATVLRALT